MTEVHRSIEVLCVAYSGGSDAFVVSKVLITARQQLGEILSAFEFFDKEALQLTLSEIAEAENPLPDTDNQFNVVIETAGSNAEHDAAKLKASQTPDKCNASFVICLPRCFAILPLS